MATTAMAVIEPETRQSAFKARALGDPMRLQMMRQLATGEHCVGELARVLNTTQQSMSHHLCLLKLRGLVEYDRRGKSNVYRLTDAGRAAVEWSRDL